MGFQTETEITNHPGWLHPPSAMRAHGDDLTAFREQVKGEGFAYAVLLGMGGSSLAPEVTAALDQLRVILCDRKRPATMFGYGPRALHPTGQLHKGGPNIGVFLQIIDDPAPGLAVPETDCTFGPLFKALALGDLTALTQRGRCTMRVKRGRDTAGEILPLVELFRA